MNKPRDRMETKVNLVLRTLRQIVALAEHEDFDLDDVKLIEFALNNATRIAGEDMRNLTRSEGFKL